jgi:hypothetical protein
VRPSKATASSSISAWASTPAKVVIGRVSDELSMDYAALGDGNAHGDTRGRARCGRGPAAMRCGYRRGRRRQVAPVCEIRRSLPGTRHSSAHRPRRGAMASRSRCCGCWRCGGPIRIAEGDSPETYAGENLRSDRIKPGSPESLVFLGHHILIFSSARIASARVTISLGSATSVLDAEGTACPTGRRALPGIAGAAAAQARGCESGTAPGLGRLGS